MRKRWIITFILLILVTAGIGFRYFNNNHSQVQWRTSKVEKGDLTISVTATGTLSAVKTIQVGTQVSGTISNLNVDFNSPVKKGQVIAELDRTFLATAVQDAEATVSKAQVQVNQTQKALDRAKNLYQQSLLSVADYDAAQTNEESARAEMRSAQAQLQRARVNLQYATITSPVDGVVISRNVDVGQTVAASFNTPTLFTIAADLTKMQVQASVDEADIGQVKLGQKVSFTVDAYPNRTFWGDVSQIRFQPTVAQNVVTYTVIINVPNDDLKLLPGMTANLNIQVTEHKNVLKVLSSALRFTPPVESEGGEHKRGNWSRGTPPAPSKPPVPGGTGTVYVLQGERPQPVQVKVGLSDGTFTEVSGQLKDGDQVVTGVIQQSPTVTPTPSPLGMPRRF